MKVVQKSRMFKSLNEQKIKLYGIFMYFAGGGGGGGLPTFYQPVSDI